MIIVIIGVTIGIVILFKIRDTYDKNKEVLLKTEYIANPNKWVKIPINKGIIKLSETDLSNTFLSSYTNLILWIDNVKHEVTIDLESIGEGDDEDVHWW